MSGAVKRRAAAPPGTAPMPSEKAPSKKGMPQNGNSTPHPTLTYPAEATDDVNMNEANGLVTLDVTLPNGQRTDINVDYNTPMLDLLVCLAGKSKLNPSGLALQLVSEDTGKPMNYTPNQIIGSLGGRVVRIVSKDELSGKSKNKSKKDKPFEITNRFTVNLPRGQKAVVRVSPLTTLGDLMNQVCLDKGLDQRRHVLQIPGKPGVPVDLGATLQQVGVHEMNLIAVALQERNHTVSMPDLSAPPKMDNKFPTYMPNAGEQKKKRGFLSFLKKDKKFKPQDARYNMETSSTTSHTMQMAQARKPSTPPAQRRGSDSDQNYSSRPKTMYVSSSAPLEMENGGKAATNNVQSVVAPAKKKRRAPAPPAPANSQPAKAQPPSTAGENLKIDKENKGAISATQNTHNTSPSTTASTAAQENAVASVSSQQVSRAEMLSRLHSRNSSDSSGYHELTLSGCESPEAAHHGNTKFKTSIDTTSIESADNANGDSGTHESPIRVSPIEEVQERSEVNSISSVPAPLPVHTDTLTSKKKRKAPPAPAPVPASQSSTITTTAAVIEIASKPVTAKTNVENSTESVQTPQVIAKEPVPTVLNTVASPDPSHPEEPQPSSTTSAPTTTITTKTIEETDSGTKSAKVTQDDADLSDDTMDLDENTGFDINDILEGIVFDEEPKSMELKVAGGPGVKGQNKDSMMMMETASVTSENIEEQFDTSSQSERPCSFIAPPPPLEPPPPEHPVVDINSLTSSAGLVFVDKGTGVNDDNTSLAPSSTKSSPATVHKRKDSFTSLGSIDTIEGISLDFEQAIQLGEEAVYTPSHDVEATSGYKNEMALFVERMSKMAVETSGDTGSGQLDDSISSLSIHGSDSNSDTGSVIQHHRTGSKDSKSGSEAGSLTRTEGKKINSYPEKIQEDTQKTFAVSEEISAPVETLPPPPEFGDKDNDKDDNAGDENGDEEEYFTETVEEFIIPIGPSGLDFTAARKTSENETVKENGRNSPKELERKGSTGVFRAEPVSIAPVSSKPTLIQPYQSKAAERKPKPPPQPAKKEEFVLTTEDLDSVTFLPPKPKFAKQPVESDSKVHVSSVSLVMDKPRNPIQNTSVYTPTCEAENESVLEVKPITLLNMPSMRASAISEPVPAFSDDSRSDSSNDPLVTKSQPRLLMNSQPSNGGSRRSSDFSHRNSFDSGADVSGVAERPGSRASAHSLDNQEQQDALQAQYFALQTQFSQWQEQLARNQNLLASQDIGPELQADQLQHLTEQMAMQRQIMEQLQSTMQALQQQQQNVHQQEHRGSSGEIPERVPEPAAAAAEPPVIPGPPPLPALAAAKGKLVKVENSKIKQRPKFERQLDPREELMLAIRGFKGREGLKSVPVQKTKWVHSNR